MTSDRVLPPVSAALQLITGYINVAVSCPNGSWGTSFSLGSDYRFGAFEALRGPDRLSRRLEGNRPSR